MPTHAISGSYGRFIFAFLRLLHADFYSDYSVLSANSERESLCPAPLAAFVGCFAAICHCHFDWGKTGSQSCFAFLFTNVI